MDGEKGGSTFPASQRPLSPEEDDEEETDWSPARPSALGFRPKPVAPFRSLTFSNNLFNGLVVSRSLASLGGAGEFPGRSSGLRSLCYFILF